MARTGIGSEKLPVEIACHIVAEREKAVAISDGTTEQVNGEERQKWFWLPRSQIEIEKKDDYYVVSMPEWLAQEKGLI